MSIEYIHNGKSYRFDPLPVSREAGRLFRAVAEIGKTNAAGRVDANAVAAYMGAFPECVFQAMKENHTEQEIDDFLMTIRPNFADPESVKILVELQSLFLGMDPRA